jgi:hypothetical protein
VPREQPGELTGPYAEVGHPQRREEVEQELGR